MKSLSSDTSIGLSVDVFDSRVGTRRYLIDSWSSSDLMISNDRRIRRHLRSNLRRNFSGGIYDRDLVKMNRR